MLLAILPGLGPGELFLAGIAGLFVLAALARWPSDLELHRASVQGALLCFLVSTILALAGRGFGTPPNEAWHFLAVLLEWLQAFALVAGAALTSTAALRQE